MDAQDPNTAVKSAILFGVSKIPEVGEVLSFIVEVLWPEKPEKDPWEEIKERAEAMIHQKLAEEKYNSLKLILTGLKTQLDTYSDELKSHSDKEHKYSIWGATDAAFTTNIPSFEAEEYQFLLLPLFAQAANLHLLLLRDALQHPDDLGLSADEIATNKSRLKKCITDYTAHARSTLKKTTGQTDPAVLDRATLLTRNVTLDVFDYVTLWPFLDQDNPHPPTMPLTREIFSDKIGWAGNRTYEGLHGNGYYPPPSDEKIKKVSFRTGSALDAITVWYGDRATPKMGGDGGRLSADWDISEAQLDKLVAVGGHHYLVSVVTNLHLWFSDGTEMNAGSQPSYRFAVPAGHYLSSINVISRFYDHDRGWLYGDLVRTVYFGFKMKPDALNWTNP